MSDQYYCFYPGDYQRDTSGLTLTEHGAYRVLLDAYYMEGSIPKEKERLYRICRAMNDTEKQAVDYIAGKYFKDNGNGHLSNKKADEEIARRSTFLAEQKRKSELGVQARKEKRDQPTGQPTGQPEGKPYHPHPHIIPPISPKKTDELFESFWFNYPAHRRKAKGRALKAWNKIKNKEEVIEQIKRVLPIQKDSKDWTKEEGQFVPLPATYLNDRRWEDEIE